MKTLTNLLKRITVFDYELTQAAGLQITYTIDGVEKHLIETDEENICELLQQIGVIERYKLIDGLVCVYYQHDEDRTIWIGYSDLLFQYDLSQKDALEIAAHNESSLIGKELIKMKNELLGLMETF